MRHRVITLATCNLDQWAMDFKGNLERVIESIKRAKELGAAYRVSCGMRCQTAERLTCTADVLAGNDTAPALNNNGGRCPLSGQGNKVAGRR